MDLSEAYPELLDIVAQKHFDYYEDYLNFSGVSKSWHSIAVQAVTKVKVSYTNGLLSRLPSLFLGEKKEDVEFRELFFLSNNTIRKIRLPEAYVKSCVSSSGWLLTVGDDYVTKLVNPLSRETFDLPDMFEHADYDDGIRKVLFSSQSQMVVVLWGCLKLTFCCIGDVNWTRIETCWHGAIHDITYYDGRVYFIDEKFRIKSCDAHGNDPVVVDVSQLPKCFRSGGLEIVYILGLDDERKKLLVVIKELLTILTEDGFMAELVTYKTKNFQVFEYDLVNGEWLKVNDLGKRTLFVGFSSSFCVEDTSGVIKANCIYYTHHSPLCIQMSATNRHDKLYRSQSNWRSYTGSEWDMGIYHMCDETIEPTHFIGDLSTQVSPPIWVQTM
ncbi:putative F-box protein At5g55150 [Rutidosis leptorrhynchoides]|uniref:putative F-box protein At5g55150 n=1 Tax=Rutidosis leptorrhynchoides TaxID=125765 RepID=UPI003A9A2AEF